MSGISEHIIDTNDAKSTFHIVKTQDCEKVMAAVAALPEHLRYRSNTQDSQKLLGTVPNILAVAWAKEWGVKLYSRAWLERVSKRLRHDPNWSGLRVKHEKFSY